MLNTDKPEKQLEPRSSAKTQGYHWIYLMDTYFASGGDRRVRGRSEHRIVQQRGRGRSQRERREIYASAVSDF